VSRALVWALTLAAAGASTTLLLAARADMAFPHERHARLFPVCIGCHAGVPTGDTGEHFPEPGSCATCHDGTRAVLVDWPGPTPRLTNLRFEHAVHAGRIAAGGADELDCAACHTQPGAPRMQIEPPIPASCFECHAHEATEHFADADCATCHRPLVETRFARSRIAALPQPSTHTREDFLEQAHGELAADAPQTCATCHAREQCDGCHVAFVAPTPADRIPSAADRIDVPPIAPRYPVPASHLDTEWERLHGREATPAACATCHTRDSCASCHGATLPPAAARLPRAADAAAPGAAIPRTMPSSHASASFATMHGPLASARPESCTSCHERSRFCGTCHQQNAAPAQRADAPQSPPAPETRRARGFHPPNFVLRHAAVGYGRRLDCATCHNTQLFCRDCHRNSAGLGSTGRLGPRYHDAEPIWLLRHGQAARQTLETCTSCHTQRDCMQCHSQLGAFRVSPHGPAFDARGAQRANPQICRACHLSDPLGGR
jgi:hypothetical protein